MLIDYISDLHVDFWIREKNPQTPKFDRQLQEYIDIIKPNHHDVLIVAGDLGHYNQQDQLVLLELKKYYKYIMLVRGNHDMYLVSKSIAKKYMYDSMNRVFEMKRWCSDNDILYLDGDIKSIEGYNFAGVGMSWDNYWYNYLNKDKNHIASRNELQEFFNNCMNDSKLIYSDSDNYDVPTAYGGRYFKSSFDPFNYFDEEYKKLQQINDFDNIDVMITHYTPVPPENYKDTHYGEDLSSTFYMFNGVKDVERISPKYWLFGHMHKEYDFKYKDTNFLCNPLGYPGENTFTVIKTIEL